MATMEAIDGEDRGPELTNLEQEEDKKVAAFINGTEEGAIKESTEVFKKRMNDK